MSGPDAGRAADHARLLDAISLILVTDDAEKNPARVVARIRGILPPVTAGTTRHELSRLTLATLDAMWPHDVPELAPLAVQ